MCVCACIRACVYECAYASLISCNILNACSSGWANFYPGTITRVIESAGAYDITFDDGERKNGVAESRIEGDGDDDCLGLLARGFLDRPLLRSAGIRISRMAPALRPSRFGYAYTATLDKSFILPEEGPTRPDLFRFSNTLLPISYILRYPVQHRTV